MWTSGRCDTRYLAAVANAGVPETHLRFPTPFAGANRIRFEGLRRTALSALWGAPLSLDVTTITPGD